MNENLEMMELVLMKMCLFLFTVNSIIYFIQETHVVRKSAVFTNV